MDINYNKAIQWTKQNNDLFEITSLWAKLTHLMKAKPPFN